MRQFLLFSLIIISFNLSYAQDTVYLDKTQKISTKENAEFIKITSSKDSLFKSEVYLLSGKLYSILNYKDKELTILNGEAIYFYANGNPDSKGIYKNNKRNGTWRFYFPSGKSSGMVYFKDGKVATADHLELYGHMVDSSKDIFPSFKGGREALILYIRRKFKPQQASEKEKVSGTVKVGFDVTETGKVTNAHIVSGINEQLNQEVINIINSMPDWHPGIQSNTPVKVPLIIPIVF